jgi:hypothetical protein
MDTLPPEAEPEDDWRLHAYSHLAENWISPWNGQVTPKGARVTVVSVAQLSKKKQLTIPLPNATALLLNSSATAYASAQEIRESNDIDNPRKNQVSFVSDKDAFDYLERMIEAILLAFTALEAFVNETIPEDFEYAHNARSKIILEVKDKPNIERHVSIDEKLKAVLPEVLKCTSPTGSRSWQQYTQLKKTRDRLIHMKTEDRKSSGPEVDTVWKALFQTPVPHLTVKAIINHFVKKMPTQPGWFGRFPHS